MPPTSAGPENRPLTSLRYFIALYVFLFHMQIRWPIIHRQWLANIINQGAIGMTFFFMLSGFIIAMNYRVLNLPRYTIARFSRIYPVYFLAGLVTLPFLNVSLLAPQIHNTLNRSIILVFMVIINLFLLQAWFPPTFNAWNNGASWSISTEAFFYFTFPLIRHFFENHSKSSKRIFMCFYFLMCLFGLGLVLFPGTNMAVAYSIPIYRLGEFICGICLFNFIQGTPSTNNINIMYLRLCFVCASFFLILDLGWLGHGLPGYISQDWVAIPFFAILLILLMQERGTIIKFLSSNFFVLLGKSSYSFYSMESFFILFALQNRNSLIYHFPILANNRYFCLLLFISTQLSALVVYFLVEVPSRRIITKKLSKLWL